MLIFRTLGMTVVNVKCQMKVFCRFSLFFVILWLLGAVAGCGYHMAGRGNLPGNVETIAIPMLVNRTAETGLETVVTNALITELNRRRKGSVARRDKADAVLSGSIDALGRNTLSRKGIHTSSERQVYVEVSVVLTRKEGDVIWKGNRLRAVQAYAIVSGDPIATDANRRQAIALLTERLAETVALRLTDAF